MDLTKLYNLTTGELRDEANRLGVTDTYALSRAQLIHAIRTRVSGDAPEGLFGRMIGFAKRAIQTSAQHAIDAEAERQRLAREAEARVQAEAEVEVEAPISEEGRVSEPPRRESTPAPVPSLFRTPTPPVPAPRASVSRAPVGVFSKSASKFEEPFPTRTMARILADQGHYKRSLAIYADLVRRMPDDRDLQGEAEKVRSQSRQRRPHA